MKIGVIGVGAIGRYAMQKLQEDGHELCALIVRPQRLEELAAEYPGATCIASAEDLPDDTEHVIDCAGHPGLSAHGPAILSRGVDVTTVSIGALADDKLHRALEQAASDGGSTLHLASGSVGALDVLQAARVGGLTSVTYTGRKPPAAWKGSPAEERVDLDSLTDAPAVHFEGDARTAASEYPKNANVAAAVALASLGLDRTRVRLIADPAVTKNIHEIRAEGAFGRFTFELHGNPLPDNPKSSALAAMSVVSKIAQSTQRIRF